MCKNSIIFMDYDNIWITCEQKNVEIYKLNFIEKINTFFKEKGYQINEIIAYANYDNGRMNRDKHQSKLQGLGVQTRHCRNGKDSADIAIACDVLEKLYLTAKDINTYIIISCDKDIAPLINKLKSQNKEVVLVTFTVNIDWDVMKNYGDIHFWFEEIIEIEYNEPEVKGELNADSFIKELKDEFERRQSDINYSLFVKSLDKKYNTDNSTIDGIRDYCISEGLVEMHEYKFNGRTYRDGIRVK
ncbi:NYN domain-containing protein [Clostridium chromiireducens]|uniref:NYN domain-containing protein n=1 Tax=Clostridium chromiireducens TaxID=225345 RepID=UPI003AF9C9B8